MINKLTLSQTEITIESESKSIGINLKLLETRYTIGFGPEIHFSELKI